MRSLQNDEKLFLHELRFNLKFAARFPPLAKGGEGFARTVNLPDFHCLIPK